MTTTPIEITQHHLNLTGQNVLTFVSWALTMILLAVTVEMGRRERSPFYVLIVLAAMAGAFAEALYDVAFSLYLRWRQCQRHNCAAAGRVPRDRLPRGGLVPGGVDVLAAEQFLFHLPPQRGPDLRITAEI